jgi:hypothetical protein
MARNKQMREINNENRLQKQAKAFKRADVRAAFLRNYAAWWYRGFQQQVPRVA